MLAPSPRSDRNTVWRLVIVAGLLPLAIAGALVLSASATIDLATTQGVPPAIAPAAVGMLEVASLAGTLMWVLVARRSLRRDAIIVTLAATGVALVAGLHSYGWFGAVGPLALVGTVHLASRAWREPWAEEKPIPDLAPRTVADLVATTAAPVAPAPTSSVEAVPGRVRDHAPDGWKSDDATWRRAVELVEDGMGRPKLADTLQISPSQARMVVDHVRKVPA